MMAEQAVIPTFNQAVANLEAGNDEPLDSYVYNNEPSGERNALNWRNRLESAIIKDSKQGISIEDTILSLDCDAYAAGGE